MDGGLVPTTLRELVSGPRQEPLKDDIVIRHLAPAPALGAAIADGRICPMIRKPFETTAQLSAVDVVVTTT
jgi:hypothetical protein